MAVPALREKADTSTRGSRPHNLAHLHRDRGYRFTDRDPKLTRLTKAISDTGWELKYISEQSGVSVGTLRKWMSGSTIHPLNITMDAVFLALGYEQVLVAIRPDVVPISRGRRSRSR